MNARLLKVGPGQDQLVIEAVYYCLPDNSLQILEVNHDAGARKITIHGFGARDGYMEFI